MIIRRERRDDAAVVREVVAEAFRGAAHSAPPVEPDGVPGEATLVGWLRDDPGWVPALALVAEDAGTVVGHVVATRARVGSGRALGLGPLSVRPDRQGRGIGSALVHAVVAAADALEEPLVALLGDPAYYGRLGFGPAAAHGVEAPDPAWGSFFQVRLLSAHAGERGPFRYAPPFDRL